MRRTMMSEYQDQIMAYSMKSTETLPIRISFLWSFVQSILHAITWVVRHLKRVSVNNEDDENPEMQHDQIQNENQAQQRVGAKKPTSRLKNMNHIPVHNLLRNCLYLPVHIAMLSNIVTAFVTLALGFTPIFSRSEITLLLLFVKAALLLILELLPAPLLRR